MLEQCLVPAAFKHKTTEYSRFNAVLRGPRMLEGDLRACLVTFVFSTKTGFNQQTQSGRLIPGVFSALQGPRACIAACSDARPCSWRGAGRLEVGWAQGTTSRCGHL